MSGLVKSPDNRFSHKEAHIRCEISLLQFCAEFVKQNIFKKVEADLKSFRHEESSSILDTYQKVLTKQLLSIDNELLMASKEISDISGTIRSLSNEPCHEKT